jgi:hypothetical protein
MMPHLLSFSIRVVCAAVLLAAALGLSKGATVVAQVDLSLHTTEQTAGVPEGSAVTVPLVLENRHRSRAATGVTVELSMPAGVAVVSDSASTGRCDGVAWTVGTVGPGARETLWLRLASHVSTPRVLTAQLGSVEPDDPTGAIVRVRVVPGPSPKKPSVAETPQNE